MKTNVLTLIISISSTLSFGQNNCNISNLWVNGTFEDTLINNHCNSLNIVNKYWDTTAPLYGYSSFIFRAGSSFQPIFVNEATIDHTLGTASGHYFYLDPRNNAGATYQIRQSIKVTAGTTYNFSAWFCSMVKSSYVSNPAVVELYVNGVPVSSLLILNSTTLNNWQKLSGTWVATSSGIATVEIIDYSPVVGGHDFAVDDIEFGAGKLSVDAGKDMSICKDSVYTLGGTPTADNGATCASEYTYSWSPTVGIITATNIANPKIKIATLGLHKYTVSVKDMNGNLCTDTVSITIVDEGCQKANSIKNLGLDNNIMLFPNPTTGLVQFANLPLTKNLFSLYNNMGQKIIVREIINNNSTIDFTQYPNGIYYYYISDEVGSVISRSKLIKF